MSWDKERIAQLQLPDPADNDPHPRLLLEGRGIHAGEGFTALFPDGWHDIALIRFGEFSNSTVMGFVTVFSCR